MSENKTRIRHLSDRLDALWVQLKPLLDEFDLTSQELDTLFEEEGLFESEDE